MGELESWGIGPSFVRADFGGQGDIFAFAKRGEDIILNALSALSALSASYV